MSVSYEVRRNRSSPTLGARNGIQVVGLAWQIVLPAPFYQLRLRLLAKFKVPSMDSFLWRIPQTQAKVVC